MCVPSGWTFPHPRSHSPLRRRVFEEPGGYTESASRKGWHFLCFTIKSNAPSKPAFSFPTMPLTDELSRLTSRTEEQLDHIDTKEKSKNALLLPFIKALGYDIFDVREVEPEFSLDAGENEKESVDYAIKDRGDPIMLFEYKGESSDLASDCVFLNFDISKANVAVITNGIVYRFFADTDYVDSMHKSPFFEFNLLNYNNDDVKILDRVTKENFNYEDIISLSYEIKYTDDIYDYLDSQIMNPSGEFARFIGEQIYDGAITEEKETIFKDIIENIFRELSTEESHGVEGSVNGSREPNELDDESADDFDKLIKRIHDKDPAERSSLNST